MRLQRLPKRVQQLFNGNVGNAKKPFSPLDLSPAAWFKYQTGVTEAGGFASQWDDQSGNGRHLKQTTGTNQPAYAAGVFTFDGSDNYMKCDAFTLNQPTTIAIVLRQNAFTVNDTFSDGNSANTGLIYQAGVSPNLSLWAGAAVNSDPDLALNTWGVMFGYFNGASSSFQTNNNAAVTGNAGAGNMGGFTLGALAAGAATFISGSVKEVVLFAGAVTGDDLTNLYTYLAAVRDA